MFHSFPFFTDMETLDYHQSQVLSQPVIREGFDHQLSKVDLSKDLSTFKVEGIRHKFLHTGDLPSKNKRVSEKRNLKLRK